MRKAWVERALGQTSVLGNPTEYSTGSGFKRCQVGQDSLFSRSQNNRLIRPWDHWSNLARARASKIAWNSRWGDWIVKSSLQIQGLPLQKQLQRSIIKAHHSSSLQMLVENWPKYRAKTKSVRWRKEQRAADAEAGLASISLIPGCLSSSTPLPSPWSRFIDNACCYRAPSYDVQVS